MAGRYNGKYERYEVLRTKRCCRSSGIKSTSEAAAMAQDTPGEGLARRVLEEPARHPVCSSMYVCVHKRQRG